MVDERIILQCDLCNEFYKDKVYYPEDIEDLRKESSEDGWLLTPEKEDICPKCKTPEDIRNNE